MFLIKKINLQIFYYTCDLALFLLHILQLILKVIKKYVDFCSELQLITDYLIFKISFPYFRSRIFQWKEIDQLSAIWQTRPEHLLWASLCQAAGQRRPLPSDAEHLARDADAPTVKLEHRVTTALMGSFQGAQRHTVGIQPLGWLERGGVGMVRGRKALLEDRASQLSPEGQARAGQASHL